MRVIDAISRDNTLEVSDLDTASFNNQPRDEKKGEEALMDLKEAREISNGGGEDYDTGHADGFLEGRENATKAAEPLLEELKKANKYLSIAVETIDAGDEKHCACGKTGKCLFHRHLIEMKDALTSSALVVAEYRKNTLGEE